MNNLSEKNGRLDKLEAETNESFSILKQYDNGVTDEYKLVKRYLGITGKTMVVSKQFESASYRYVVVLHSKYSDVWYGRKYTDTSSCMDMGNIYSMMQYNFVPATGNSITAYCGITHKLILMSMVTPEEIATSINKIIELI